MAKLKMTVKTRKNAAWNAFSKYIRLRDCLEQTGFPDQGCCVTCEKWYPYEELQAGHFLGGRTKQVLFQEQGVHNQCAYCNKHLNGNTVKYLPFMKEKYGQETIDRLVEEANANQGDTWNPVELLEIQQKYEDKYKKLYESATSFR